MGVRIDPGLSKRLARFGGESATKCFNCGNCTAVCSLSAGDTTFPRMQIRYMQLGLPDKLVESPEPWMCYYCGGCSDTCPRQAEPGELMMAARRWLTSKYDWTGISRLMYLHEFWEIAFPLLVALVVLLLFSLPTNFGFGLLAQHPEALDTVMLQYFAPKELVHIGDLVMAGLLAFLLLSNAARMVMLVMRNTPAPLWLYVREFKELVIHFLTQKRWARCDDDRTAHWLRHMALVLGYGTMFLLVVVFLATFQVENTGIHWTAYLGYFATLLLLGVSSWMFIDRLRKKDQSHKHSHLSDWMFIVLLFLTSLSGILLHLCRILNLPLATYVLYLVHLMIAVPMLVVEVPFGKWAHLAYRPLAAYLCEVKSKARTLTRRASVPATVSF